jgi:hypothetical protein
MRVLTTLPCLGVALLAAQAFGQTLPGKPEDNGIRPVTETLYVNTTDTINNNNTESLGIGIARNGNIIVGWEDDGDALTDLEAVWTLFDRDGKQVTQDTEITSVDPAFAGQTLTSKFLSFFRANKSAVSGRTGWGPKIKANPFGDGVGMGATSFDLGLEVVEFAPYQDSGDWPAVQLLSNNGEPISIVNGVPVDYGARAGNIRIGDWDYLSTGNILVVGESRQTDDLVSIYKGEAAQNHVIFRIVDPTGKEITATQLASATPTKSEMWHGAGVTKSGFAIRFSDNGPGRIRLFDNTGKAVSTNLDLATIAGNPIAGGGGRGDGVGFHGNGNDAYASVAIGKDADGKNQVWVTVLNASGTLRWSKAVSDDLELIGPGRCDVGIDALGRVAVVYEDASGTGGNAKIVLGRVFDQTGKPLGKTFYVSEKELPDAGTLESRNPRVAFRGDSIAVTWESRNGGADARVVAFRSFVVPVRPGSIESVGLTRIVADTPVIVPTGDALGNWEPYASVLGTSTFLIEANTFAQDSADQQRFVVALQPAAGGAPKLGEAFFNDAGVAYKGPINLSRQNGNPGRVGGDKRPGAVNFITGAEASPHAVEGFDSGNRWNTGFDRLDNGRYGTVQIFKLDPATLTQTPLTKALDSANGRLTSGGAPDPQISRFGGDVLGLSDGNFVSVVEDRSRVRRTDGNCAVATIFAADGSVVKEAWKIADGDLWSNVAAYNGGFAVRVAGKLYFHNNAGVLQGEAVAQTTSGENFDPGRGDGTRLGAHINQPYVYLVGRVVGSTAVRVAAWDARTREFAVLADVSEDGFRADADRANIDVDALGRFTVAWVSKPDGYEAQQIAARVFETDTTAKTIKPLTASFLPFVNSAPQGGITSVGMSVAMTTKQILVAAKGSINLQNRPDQGANSPREINFYTVISHPAPKDDPTTPVGGGGSAPKIKVSLANGVLTITSEPQPMPAGFVFEASDTVAGPWSPLPGANTPVQLPLGTQPSRFLRAVKR